MLSAVSAALTRAQASSIDLAAIAALGVIGSKLGVDI
jgi:hypothetical protein